MNKPMMPYMIGKFIDEDIYTIHILRGKDYHLLAEFTYQQIPAVVDKLQAEYPIIASKLKNHFGGGHERV